ncbi:MAG: efflux RND transporter periplasmic adaptor subunit [Planctomycetota bacterium]
MKRIAVTLVVVLVVGLLGWQIYRKLTGAKESGGSARRTPAVAVLVAPVQRAAIRDVGYFTGTLLAKSQFLVAPKVSGRLEKLFVNIGEPVKNGGLIALLDSQEYGQQVEEARAELEVGKANLADCHSALEVAGREQERVQELRQQKIASEAELDQAQANYRACEAKQQVALAQIRQKEAALKAAEVRLSYTRIEAVWEDGGGQRLVAERFVDEGAMLKANDPIISVVDTSLVIAVIYVIERDFPEVLLGQAATVDTDAYPGREFYGKIARRAPVLREESRQARVEIEVPNPDGSLAPGMFVRVSIELAEHQDAVVVPMTALVRRNGREGVFLADTKEMTCRFVPVTLGIANGDSAEVLDPKLEGMVVTLGQHLLEDGAPIAPSDTKSAPVGERPPGAATAAPKPSVAPESRP